MDGMQEPRGSPELTEEILSHDPVWIFSAETTPDPSSQTPASLLKTSQLGMDSVSPFRNV